MSPTSPSPKLTPPTLNPSPPSTSTPPSTSQPQPPSQSQLQPQSQSTDIKEPTSTIHFTKSHISVPWHRSTNLPILRVAENAGLKPNYGCRSGACGTCEVKLLKGEVEGPEGDYDRGILICSSRPVSREVEIEL